MALAVLVPLAACGVARSDPPAPSDPDGIDDLIGTAGGQKSRAPKRPADDKDDPADLLKGLDAPKPPAPKGSPPAKGLPKYYDQLDLTPEQIDKIHKVSEKYDGRIAELKQRLERLRGAKVIGGMGATVFLISTIKMLTAQRHEALMDVLTEEQQSKLKKLYAAEEK
jgi:hypothetical protein